MLPNQPHLLNHHSFMMFYAKDRVIFPVFFFTFQSQSGDFINAVGATLAAMCDFYT